MMRKLITVFLLLPLVVPFCSAVACPDPRIPIWGSTPEGELLGRFMAGTMTFGAPWLNSTSANAACQAAYGVNMYGNNVVYRTGYYAGVNDWGQGSYLNSANNYGPWTQTVDNTTGKVEAHLSCGPSQLPLFVHWYNPNVSSCVWNQTQLPNYTPLLPIAGYNNYSCQGTGTYCGLPATLYVDDNSQYATSVSWDIDHQEFGSMLTSTAESLQWNITYAGNYRILHTATNPNGTDTQYIYFLATENATAPNVNITGNITPPNFTPVIPTIPETLAPLPSSLNRTNVRTLINSSVFANVSAEYLDYWDNFYDGLKDMFKNILDTLFYPVTTIREYLEIPSEWMLQLASQYAEKSNNLTVYFFRTVYAFPPKLLNLVTYSLVLDFVLVLMHEFGGKK